MYLVWQPLSYTDQYLLIRIGTCIWRHNHYPTRINTGWYGLEPVFGVTTIILHGSILVDTDWNLYLVWQPLFYTDQYWLIRIGTCIWCDNHYSTRINTGWHGLEPVFGVTTIILHGSILVDTDWNLYLVWQPLFYTDQYWLTRIGTCIWCDNHYSTRINTGWYGLEPVFCVTTIILYGSILVDTDWNLYLVWQPLSYTDQYWLIRIGTCILCHNQINTGWYSF